MAGKFKRVVDESLVKTLYYEQKLSLDKCSKILGIPITTLYYFMDAKGMKRRIPNNMKPSSLVKTFSDFEVGYLVGLLDGEGSVSLSHRRKDGKTYWIPMVQITNTNVELLQRIKEITGVGTVYIAKKLQKGQNHHMANITWTGRTAIDMVRRLQPYLIVKREKAKQILSEWALKERLHTPLGYWKIVNGSYVPFNESKYSSKRKQVALATKQPPSVQL